MDKETLISIMQTSRQQFLQTLDTIRRQSLDEPVLPQGWSIKDLLAHIGFWEARATRLFRLLKAGQLPDPEVDDLSTDEFNARNYQENRQRSWEDIRQAEESSFEALLQLVKGAMEEDLFNPERFAWTEGQPFVDWIEGNTYGHYEEHLRDLPDVHLHP
jgi:hypothetical protein